MLHPRDLKGRTAISYARWSSGSQASGDSLRRQSENAERFCSTYGLTLDHQLVDNGVSAFKGLNLEARLGQFIADVKAGKISNDVVLILENLDRFTRINPVDAVPVLLELLKTGLTLVTLQDERVHTRTAYADNTMHLMMSLMAMQAAYEYSAKISQRVGAEWSNRAKRARQGRVKISKVPFWIDQQTQELNDRADDARLIFRLAQEGNGQWTITNYLNDAGIPSSRGGTWGKSMVQDVLKSKAAYGALVIKGEEVPNYYPPLITETAWLAIQHRQRQRYQNPQASGTTNIFPRLVRCAHCRSPMVVTSSKVRGKIWRYFACEGRSLKRTDCTAPNWRYDSFETEFLARVGFLAAPIPAVDGSAPMDSSGELVDAIAALENQHSNILAGMAEAFDAASRRVLLDRAHAISTEIAVKKNELVRVRENDARYQETKPLTDIETDLEVIQRLAKEDRKEAQRLIANLVERIDLESDSHGPRAGNGLRRALVTLRSGWSHAMVFDDSAEP
ncbi:recombinase family protein [Mesorhizobium sp.]|uniref:recombinase family protein n=1 Tax=Mesorhizobium sp. TaxID=1871066 RepID=UPI000FE5FFA8|nr:recombinase family protein [Mesorhizobium sp.]RWQ60284.1 MAG: recombinase family protein [Mesorhizobium sp.]